MDENSTIHNTHFLSELQDSSSITCQLALGLSRALIDTNRRGRVSGIHLVSTIHCERYACSIGGIHDRCVLQ